ncbi:DUF6482 family protein [Marinobacter sp. C2H3]|uniref:DUF6482 family protein n=1 Tax=Marinobacter sp. C2H3 TaxID=3119003 RepID=UPI00300F1006
MHMTIGTLRASRQTPISLLEIVSMEGRCYMARFHRGEQVFILTDAADRPMMFPGACAVRDCFREHTLERVEVIPPTGTDEMIGMPQTGDEVMRVPLK